MHDPMHVVFDVLRPWPHRAREARPRRDDGDPLYRHRQVGPINVRAARFRCPHCDDGRVKDPPPSYHDELWPGAECPDCLGRGYTRVSLRGRLPYLSMHFWRLGRREWYFPAVVTVWHVDPETDGTDSSCRNRYKRWHAEARADGDSLRAWWWWKVMAHYDKWHLHHWSLQFRPWQDFNRWAWSRCATCGGLFAWGEAPVSDSWGGDGPRWRKPEQHKHHMRCREGVGAAEQPPVAA